MLYLLAIFVSPLALLLAGAPLQFVLNAILYALAILGWFFFAVPGFVFWMIAVAHAFAVIASRQADRRMRKIMRAQQVKRAGT